MEWVSLVVDRAVIAKVPFKCQAIAFSLVDELHFERRCAAAGRGFKSGLWRQDRLGSADIVRDAVFATRPRDRKLHRVGAYFIINMRDGCSRASFTVAKIPCVGVNLACGGCRVELHSERDVARLRVSRKGGDRRIRRLGDGNRRCPAGLPAGPYHDQFCFVGACLRVGVRDDLAFAKLAIAKSPVIGVNLAGRVRSVELHGERSLPFDRAGYQRRDGFGNGWILDGDLPPYRRRTARAGDGQEDVIVANSVKRVRWVGLVTGGAIAKVP